MPNKTLPTTGSTNWGENLNNFLTQSLDNTNGGGINKFEQFSQRPTLTADDKGKTYLYTQTGNFHQWTGTAWKVLNESLINVKDYGAVGDGVTDDTAFINSAILKAALADGGKIIVPFSNYLISGTIIIPRNVEIDFCDSKITGSGIGSSTDLFQTGYLSGGKLVTNIGEPDEAHLVVQASVKNATIWNCGKAFNLLNWIDNSEISNIKFWNCGYAVYADRCWYGRFINLFSRNEPVNTATNAAFHFTDFVNVCNIQSVFVAHRDLGIEIENGANGQVLLNCSAEGCKTGIKVSGETGPIKFDTCYIEANTEIGVDLQSGLGFKYDVTFENCFFNTCKTAIRSDNSNSGGATVFVRENNRFIYCETNLDASGNVFSYGKVETESEIISGNGYPILPPGFLLGTKMRLDYENLIFDSVSGLGLIRTKVHGPTLIAFNHEGNSGSPMAGTVPFCVNSKSAGTPFSIYVDTKIVFQQHAALLAYKLQISDNNGTYEVYGFIFGDQVKMEDASGKTVAVSNNNGYVRLTVGTFSHPTGVYSITGIVRHI
jgi:hypothetical protein